MISLNKRLKCMPFHHKEIHRENACQYRAILCRKAVCCLRNLWIFWINLKAVFCPFCQLEDVDILDSTRLHNMSYHLGASTNTSAEHQINQ
eukprot:UN03737